MNYDVIIIGAGPGGIFSAYELTKDRSDLRVAVFEAGHSLEKRHCPIDGDKVKSCIRCKSCSIMSGFGGAGAFSDGKYNITNDFGGTLHEYIGKKQALDLMHYVDEINMAYGGEGTKLYSTAGTKFKKLCIQNKLNLLDASVRHLGTDVNLVVLSNLYASLKDKVDFYFDSPCHHHRPRGRWLPRHRRRDGLHLRQVHRLRRPRRQQVDGGRVPGAQYPHEVEPRRYRCARRDPRRRLLPPD